MMTYFYRVLGLTLLLPSMSLATAFFDVDDELPESRFKSKGLTVEVPVSRYYPTDTESALYKVLKQAQILTANVSFMGSDGVPYKQHDWKAESDRANLKRGIDCSRAIWFAFTRAGVSYNRRNRYLTTSDMWQSNSDMAHYFRSCSVDDLRLGDVLVYRKGNESGHTVMVLDPDQELAWGSHGWDKSGRKDTGVEVQKVVSRAGWRYWDLERMKLKACWRHQAFTEQPVLASITSELGQYPETRSQRLSDADLRDKTRYALWMMRNEMFARYGYRFKNEALAAHFQQQSWYWPTFIDVNAIFYYRFSDIERSNVKFIYQYEQNRIAGKVDEKPETQPAGDYPETATRRLTYADIADKSSRELRLMRNEMFARHGYRFGQPDLQRHFEQQSWYQPRTTNGTDLYNNSFSAIERYNVKFIRRYE